MRAINGVKVFRVGENDWVYAVSTSEAKQVMVKLMDVETVNEIIEDDPISELSDEEFNEGEMHFDCRGYLDMDKAPLVRYRDVLTNLTEDGSTGGHFMTMEH